MLIDLFPLVISHIGPPVQTRSFLIANLYISLDNCTYRTPYVIPLYVYNAALILYTMSAQRMLYLVLLVWLL